jgi:hypothetical protein
MLQRQLENRKIRKLKPKGQKNGEQKGEKNTNTVFVRTLGVVSQTYFLPLLHILLGPPVTSPVPSDIEMSVRKVKITQKLFLGRDALQLL